MGRGKGGRGVCGDGIPLKGDGMLGMTMVLIPQLSKITKPLWPMVDEGTTWCVNHLSSRLLKNKQTNRCWGRKRND